MIYPKSVRSLKTVVDAGAVKFAVSKREAFYHLMMVLWMSEDLIPPSGAVLEGDIVITCELCADTQWWRDNYGSLWEWAQWWYCGPFGLDCNPSPA